MGNEYFFSLSLFPAGQESKKVYIQLPSVDLKKRLCLPSDDFKKNKLVACGRGRGVCHIDPHTV